MPTPHAVEPMAALTPAEPLRIEADGGALQRPMADATAAVLRVAELPAEPAGATPNASKRSIGRELIDIGAALAGFLAVVMLLALFVMTAKN